MSPPTSTDNPITITVRTAMNLSGLGQTKLYELIASGVLQTTKLGKRRLVVYDSLKALLVPGSDPRRKPGRPRKIERVTERTGAD